jgi:hypothetical protein
MREGQTFSVTEEHWYKYDTLSKRKGKQQQNKSLMKQTFCTCRPITLKSRYCAKIHYSVVQTIWHLTIQYENYCGISNWSFIKLTMTWNQNCLKANKQRLYNHLICVEKLLILFLRPSTKIWIANAARGNEKVADRWIIWNENRRMASV